MIWVGNRTLYVESFYNHRIRTTNEQHLEWFDSSAIRATQIKSAVMLYPFVGLEIDVYYSNRIFVYFTVAIFSY
jgi:hypothetical protein